jgi:L-erythro-3,5-diaminohexanoate dehydrogenase
MSSLPSNRDAAAREQKGQPFGAHRVLEPSGALPQPAWRVDNRFDTIWDNEIVVDVETLNVDAASFKQMEDATIAAGAADGSAIERGVADLVRKTVGDRGKQHNPVTGSGGMLLGRVAHVGAALQGKVDVAPGDRIATLVSLSLTPLRVDEIKAVRRASAQLDVVGKAAIFEGAPFARMPGDMPERLALAVLDVAGAAIQVSRRAKLGDSVVVLGAGGKSGILCAAEARKAIGRSGRLIGVESYAPFAADLRALDICDEVLAIDARDALGVHRGVLEANGGREVDLAICCVNVEGVEMATILPVRDRGCAYFFSMSTSFGRAALGAEGVGKDIELIVGNGYAQGHADHALALVRSQPAIRALFEKRYG